MPKTIKVIMVRVGQDPMVEDMDNNLEAMQKAVGGYIEGAAMLKPNVMLMCNEEGRCIGLPANRYVLGADLIVGDFFITRHDKNGKSVSLTKADIKQLLPLVA
jgi:hypothetical protein